MLLKTKIHEHIKKKLKMVYDHHRILYILSEAKKRLFYFKKK